MRTKIFFTTLLLFVGLITNAQIKKDNWGSKNQEQNNTSSSNNKKTTSGNLLDASDNYSGKTKIGKNCLIMATAHIAHDCHIGNNSIVVNGVALGGHVVIGKYAIIGGLAAVHQFIHIGDHAMVSGGSLVRKDVPPFTKAGKEPLSYVGINSIGLRRRGFSTEKIRQIQDIYRILYQKNYNNTQAVEKIEAEMEATPERDEIILFIKNSQRGIMKGYWGG